MSSAATVFSTAQYGLADEATATGLHIASVSFAGSSELSQLPDHIGNTVGLSVHERMKSVSCQGVIKTKGSGLVGTIGSLLTLANTTTNTRTRLSEGLGVTPVAGAGILITGNNIEPQQKDFESGSVDGVFYPHVDLGSPATIT
jgi:hypothetical protein